MARRRVQQLEAEVEALRTLLPAEALQGATMPSPFAVADESTPTGRSVLPWRRQHATPARTITEAAPQGGSNRVPVRAGFLADVPRGGATEWNQGYTQIGGVADRHTFMVQLQELYVACPWSAACIDTIARFSTAGGMSIEEDGERLGRQTTLTRQAQKCQDLFDYVNPEQNFRQLMRTIFTDLLIYGDAFIEVGWALGEPIALWNLPCPTMLIEADEHGVVSRYVQHTETDRKAYFKPHQVIHIRFDSPRGGLYGLGPTEKNVHPIVTWIATEALLKRTMERGNPPNLAIAWDMNLAENEIKKFEQQYLTRNMGAANVGNPISMKGDTSFHELRQEKLAEYIAIKTNSRDEILAGYGVPPAQVSVIESGNLGGGTGTSQFKSFRVNTCGPIEELVLEAFTFFILEQGFGVVGKHCEFEQVDWRDDEVIEKIRTQRVERGGWTVNRYRAEIGEPEVEGGDDAIIIQTRDVVLVKDLAEMSKAVIAKDGGAPATPSATPTAAPAAPVVGGTIKPQPAGAPAAPTDGQDPKHATGAPGATESDDDLLAAWEADVAERRARALAELEPTR